MSVYDNDTSKIYPTLGPSAPPSQEVNPQTYRLAKISEIEAYFLDEIDIREKLAKKIKRFNTITAVLDTSLITTTAITGGISIAAISSGIGLPAGISLSASSLLLSLATTITRKQASSSLKKKSMTIYDCLRKVSSIVSVELFLRQYKMKMFSQQSFIRFYRKQKIIVNLKQILEREQRQNKPNFQKNSVKKY